MDHMTSNYGTYQPSATVGGVGNIQSQILDALQILTTPKMVVDDPKALRDKFAMAALTGIVQREGGNQNLLVSALEAYDYADAMMQAREANDGHC